MKGKTTFSYEQNGTQKYIYLEFVYIPSSIAPSSIYTDENSMDKYKVLAVHDEFYGFRGEKRIHRFVTLQKIRV